MTQWYVVYTQANSEQLAVQHLARQGFQTLLPTYKCLRSHARRREVVRRPLFPRYLFVALDPTEQRWRPILSTVGVSDLVRLGSKPSPLPLGLAEEITERAAVGEFDRLSPLEGLRKGDDVEVLDGPFADMVGRFIGLTDNERVLVLLDFLGRQVKATLSRVAVNPA